MSSVAASLFSIMQKLMLLPMSEKQSSCLLEVGCFKACVLTLPSNERRFATGGRYRRAFRIFRLVAVVRARAALQRHRRGGAENKGRLDVCVSVLLHHGSGGRRGIYCRVRHFGPLKISVDRSSISLDL